MGRSRLPLVALLGAVGCTKQDAAEPHEATAAEDSPPWRVKGARPGDESAKGSSIRALTPEERANLVAAPAAPAPVESSDAGTPPDYAEQRQRSYEKRMQQLQEDAQLRQEGSGLMAREAAADQELLDGPAPQDIGGQRRLQLAKDRREAERIRKEGYRKGSGITGIKRKDFILHALARERPPLVFNLCDTLGGEGAPALLVPTVLDALGVPYTGADARGLALTKSKHALKALLASEGVPTPRFQCIHDAADAEDFSLELEPPVVLKPCGEHASIGLEAASVAWNDAEVRARARHLLGRFKGPVLVEEYVGGREFYVSVAGYPPRALPVMEQTFGDLPEGYLRMRTFDAKWFTEPGLSGDAPLLEKDARWRQPVPMRQPASRWRRRESVEELCVRAFRLAGGRDWGRVEFRVDASGVPLLIDVTPNSYLAPSAPCVLAAREAGLSYEAFLTLIAGGALERAAAGD